MYKRQLSLTWDVLVGVALVALMRAVSTANKLSRRVVGLRQAVAEGGIKIGTGLMFDVRRAAARPHAFAPC